MQYNLTPCIINVSTGIHIKAQQRLRASLEMTKFKGDLFFWSDELPNGTPSHNISPWAFKPYAFKAAQEKGYSQILWLDANMIVIRNIQKIFNHIKKHGYYIQSYGSTSFGEWCSDIALQNFDITREQSLHIGEVSPSFLGLNLLNDTAVHFLADWHTYASDAITFRGIPPHIPLERTNNNTNFHLSKHPAVKGHRHDQSAASFLVWKYKMKPSRVELLNYQYKDSEGKNNYRKAIPFNTIVLQNRDIKSEQYLHSVNVFGNTLGLNRIPFMLRSFLLTILEHIRYITMLHTYFYYDKLK